MQRPRGSHTGFSTSSRSTGEGVQQGQAGETEVSCEGHCDLLNLDFVQNAGMF